MQPSLSCRVFKHFSFISKNYHKYFTLQIHFDRLAATLHENIHENQSVPVHIVDLGVQLRFANPHAPGEMGRLWYGR